MKNVDIHNSLVEIEKNLKDLKSARTQVNDVSAKSEDMVIALTKILSQLELFQQELNDKKQFEVDKLSQSINTLYSTVEDKLTKVVNNSNALNNDLAESTMDIKHQIDAFSILLNKEEQEFKDKISKSFDDFSILLGQKSEGYFEKAKDLDKLVSLTVEKSKLSLDQFQIRINDFSDKLNEFDVEKFLTSISTQFGDLERQMSSLKTISISNKDEIVKSIELKTDVLVKDLNDLDSKCSTIKDLIVNELKGEIKAFDNKLEAVKLEAIHNIEIGLNEMRTSNKKQKQQGFILFALTSLGFIAVIATLIILR